MSEKAAPSNPFLTLTANAISTILTTNFVIIVAVAFGMDIIRRVFPQIYHAQDIIRGVFDEKKYSLEGWFDRRELTWWGKLKGWFSSLWIVEISKLKYIDYVERSGFQCYLYFRWQRLTSTQLLVFISGSLFVLIPVNLFADPVQEAEDVGKVPLFIKTATSQVRRGSPWLWVHVALLALYAIYFCYSYTHFLRGHVALIQALMRRPLIQSRAILVRNIPEYITTRGTLEEFLVSASPNISRICPVPLHSRRLSRRARRLRRLRARVLGAEPEYFKRIAVFLQWQGSTPLVRDSSGVIRELAHQGQWHCRDCSLDEDLRWIPRNIAEESGLPAFIESLASQVDLESPWGISKHSRRVLAYGVFGLSEGRLFLWPRTRPGHNMRRLHSYKLQERAEEMEKLRAELSEQRASFFLPSAPIGSLAFVLFQDEQSASSYSQSLFFPDSTQPQLEPAPSPDDIVWPSVAHADRNPVIKGLYFTVTVFLVLLTYLLPVSAINVFFASGNWSIDADGFEWVNRVLAAIPLNLRPLIAGYAPSLLLSLLMALFPLIARSICLVMSPLTQSTLTYQVGTFIWLFLSWSIIINSLIVNVGSEVLRLFTGAGSETLASLLSLVNQPMATALANNASVFATYILQRHLLGPALQLLRVCDLRILITDIMIERWQQRFITEQRSRLDKELKAESERAARQLEEVQIADDSRRNSPISVLSDTSPSSSLFRDATSEGVSPPEQPAYSSDAERKLEDTLRRVREYRNELDSLESTLSMSRTAKQRLFSDRFGLNGGTRPFDLANAVATDAFLTAVAFMYCVFAPLLAPLVVLVFCVRICADRWILFHTTPPLPDPLPQHDVIVAGTRWLVVGEVFGTVMSAFYFATQGSIYMGHACICIGVFVALYAVGLNARFRRSLKHRALRIPCDFLKDKATQLVSAGFTRFPPLSPGEDIAMRTDYEFPGWLNL